MEKLDTDLGKILDTKPNIPLSLKLSILLDVSYGLLYLHTLSPKPIIHRDLTASNILLTSDMRAKIADLGVSKLIDRHAQPTAKHTKAPGTPNYMPMEALKEKAVYGVELDVFSFGHLALHTANQNYPEVYVVTLTSKVIQSGELQIHQRKEAFNKMGDCHCLVPLVKQCLKDDPTERPTTADLNTILKGLCTKHPKSLIDGEELGNFAKEHPGYAEAFKKQQDQISTLEQLKEDILNDLGAARAEAQIYKEDFEKERRDRAEAFGKMEELRRQHDEEVQVLTEEVNRLQRELVIHQQQLEDVELVAQEREKHAVKVVQELDRAQEDVRAKTSQVKQYKKQVDQLKAQVTGAEAQNVRLFEAMSAVRSELEKCRQDNGKLSKEIQRLTKENQKVAKRKKSDRSLVSPDQPMSLPIHTESQLAKTESLFEKERSENEDEKKESEDLLSQVQKLEKVNEDLKARRTSAVATKKYLEANLSKMVVENERLKALVESASAGYESTRQKNEQLEGEQVIFVELTKKIASEDVEHITMLNKKIEELEAQLQRQQQQQPEELKILQPSQ